MPNTTGFSGNFRRSKRLAQELVTPDSPTQRVLGAVRQLDPAIAARRPLSFFAYGLGDVQGWEIAPTHGQLLDALASFGLPVSRDRVGYKVNSREPRWVVAHKYPAQEQMTVVRDIDEVGGAGPRRNQVMPPAATTRCAHCPAGALRGRGYKAWRSRHASASPGFEATDRMGL